MNAFYVLGIAVTFCDEDHDYYHYLHIVKLMYTKSHTYSFVAPGFESKRSYHSAHIPNLCIPQCHSKAMAPEGWALQCFTFLIVKVPTLDAFSALAPWAWISRWPVNQKYKHSNTELFICLYVRSYKAIYKLSEAIAGSTEY